MYPLSLLVLVCNKYHDVLITTCELKYIPILNVKGVDFRCILVAMRLLITSTILC